MLEFATALGPRGDRLTSKQGTRMNQFTGSIASLRHPEQLENLWLAHWHIGRCHFDFITAESIAGESSCESLDREVAWILDLR